MVTHTANAYFFVAMQLFSSDRANAQFCWGYIMQTFHMLICFVK